MCDIESSSKKKYEFIPITTCPLQIGTRLFWDECSAKLYFVDLPKYTVYRYDPALPKAKRLTKAEIGEFSSIETPLSSWTSELAGSPTKFIAGIGRKIVFVEWDGKAPAVPDFEVICEVDKEPDLCNNRLNGAKVDPWGRLWAGTMGPEENGNVVPGKGSLYCLKKGCITKKKCNIGISNGLAWDMKKMKMYFCDTLKPKVFQYNLSKDGNISKEQVVFEFDKNYRLAGKPDGLTIDSKGNVWVCAIFGSALVKIDLLNGTVVFGGPKFEDLYVTTARIATDGCPPGPPAGTVYRVKGAGVTGLKGDKYIP
ncbi:unnamed protein product [Phyllotreta striolata]|uniref:SMP-30/Gluconolactonase/LRE-like region domain-containing protein n=1 Tax=Phyllotreta striolata TaxID=444603 RepID=A0A9N9TN75_PHYSR|nr:unnamed protein product [Phyllotreta striolata]